MRGRIPVDQGVSGHGDRASPTCLLHVPKSAGKSILAALETALPPGSVAPQCFDTSLFCDFDDFDLLRPEIRSLIVVGPDEVRSLGRHRAIVGHFSLDTLLELTDAESICTVLREPRTRLLSFYMYWRIPDVGESWAPYRAELHALRPLGEFLAEPYLAPVIDNQLCRLLLGDDPRLPPQGFARQSDVATIAADAIERLATLGFVGVLELGESVWGGMSRAFGVALHPTMVHVTGEVPPLAVGADETLFDADALELIEQRCAADAMVYDHVLGQAGLDERAREQMSNAAFAAELVKLGDLLGHSTILATERIVAELRSQLSEQERSSAEAIQRLREELRREALAVRNERQELEAARHWLDVIQASASWRLTSPLRAVKRGLRGVRSA